MSSDKIFKHKPGVEFVKYRARVGMKKNVKFL